MKRSQERTPYSRDWKISDTLFDSVTLRPIVGAVYSAEHSRHTNKISCLTHNRCDLPSYSLVLGVCMLSKWKVTKGISCYITSLAFVGRHSRHLCSSEILFHEAPKACHSVLYFSSSIFDTFNGVCAANTVLNM